MKLIEIVNARDPLQRIVKQELPLRAAYSDMERIIISLDGDLKLSAGDVKMLMPLVEFQ